jgi:hypothetical protein
LGIGLQHEHPAHLRLQREIVPQTRLANAERPFDEQRRAATADSSRDLLLADGKLARARDEPTAREVTLGSQLIFRR